VLLLVGSECASYANADIAKNKARRDHCNAYLGPYQPGVTSPDPTEDGGPDASAQAKKLKTKSKRKAGDPEAPATPGQPDPSHPQYTLPPEVQQIINTVTGHTPASTPSTPATPATPAAPPTPNTGDQTPGQLLDFLLGP
jgi:hypothetical protein